MIAALQRPLAAKDKSIVRVVKRTTGAGHDRTAPKKYQQWDEFRISERHA
jgi:hypothetical protein